MEPIVVKNIPKFGHVNGTLHFYGCSSEDERLNILEKVWNLTHGLFTDVLETLPSLKIGDPVLAAIPDVGWSRGSIVKISPDGSKLKVYLQDHGYIEIVLTSDVRLVDACPPGIAEELFSIPVGTLQYAIEGLLLESEELSREDQKKISRVLKNIKIKGEITEILHEEDGKVVARVNLQSSNGPIPEILSAWGIGKLAPYPNCSVSKYQETGSTATVGNVKRWRYPQIYQRKLPSSFLDLSLAKTPSTVTVPSLCDFSSMTISGRDETGRLSRISEGTENSYPNLPETPDSFQTNISFDTSPSKEANQVSALDSIVHMEDSRDSLAIPANFNVSLDEIKLKIPPVGATGSSVIKPIVFRQCSAPTETGDIASSPADVGDGICEKVKLSLLKPSDFTDGEPLPATRNIKRLSSFIPLELSVGSAYQVVVTSVSNGPAKFSIQLVTDSAVYQSMSVFLNSYQGYKKLELFAPGTTCVVRKPTQAYRAIIIKFSREKSLVYMVDLGEQEEVKLDDLYELPEETHSHRVLSLRCSLSGFGQLSAKACDRFAEVVRYEILECRIVKNFPSEVELFMKGVNIADILGDSGTDDVRLLPSVGPAQFKEALPTNLVQNAGVVRCVRAKQVPPFKRAQTCADLVHMQNENASVTPVQNDLILKQHDSFPVLNDPRPVQNDSHPLQNDSRPVQNMPPLLQEYVATDKPKVNRVRSVGLTRHKTNPDSKGLFKAAMREIENQIAKEEDNGLALPLDHVSKTIRPSLDGIAAAENLNERLRRKSGKGSSKNLACNISVSTDHENNNYDPMPQTTHQSSFVKQATSYPTPILDIGSVLEVIITCIDSPSVFFVVADKQDSALHFERFLNSSSTLKNMENVIVPYVGLPCIYPDENGWMRRGLITSIVDSEARVRAVDYGTEQVVSVTLLKKMPDDFAKVLPPRSIQCSLHTFEEVCYTPDVIQKFTELAPFGVRHKMTVIKKNAFGYEVELENQYQRGTVSSFLALYKLSKLVGFPK